MVLEPTERGMIWLWFRYATVIPFTLTEVLVSVAVGLTVIELMLLATDAVYSLAVDEKAGLKVTLLNSKADNVAVDAGVFLFT